MLKRLAFVLTIAALGASLGGCSKCGWIWDDWGKPRSCMSDVPKQ